MACTFNNGSAWDAWLAFGRNISICLGAVENRRERVERNDYLVTPAIGHDSAASESVDILQTIEEEVEEVGEDRLDPPSLLHEDSTPGGEGENAGNALSVARSAVSFASWARWYHEVKTSFAA
jgi:hypothetical protein